MKIWRIVVAALARMTRRQGKHPDMGDKGDQVRSDKLILPAKRGANLGDLARSTSPVPGTRKLPPEPGRAPRGSSVPPDEILPRKKKS
ncbi:MAG TPA: hypothetical protein VKB68_09670 [Stellaceae bacterium]|nr:hypothetical protein [Stellaceae bacterium]